MPRARAMVGIINLAHIFLMVEETRETRANPRRESIQTANRMDEGWNGIQTRDPLSVRDQC